MQFGAVLLGGAMLEITGVDLSKILEGQTQIWGEMWWKLIIACAFLSYCGARPGSFPPKSITPMANAQLIGGSSECGVVNCRRADHWRC